MERAEGEGIRAELSDPFDRQMGESAIGRVGKPRRRRLFVIALPSSTVSPGATAEPPMASTHADGPSPIATASGMSAASPVVDVRPSHMS